MIKDVGAGVEHDLDTPVLRVEIGDEHFDDDRRIHLADCVDRPCKMVRAAVFEIIARHCGDDHVFQTHSAHRFRDTLRLVFFQRKRLRGADCAEPTGASAAFAGDHHGCSALAPAFPAVGALRALANGVEAQVGNESLGGEENRIGRQAHFDPGRLLRLVQGRIDLRAGHHGEGKSDV